MAFFSAILGKLAALGKIVGVAWEGFKLNFVYQAGKDAAARKALELKAELQDEYMEILRRKPGTPTATRDWMRERAARNSERVPARRRDDT